MRKSSLAMLAGPVVAIIVYIVLPNAYEVEGEAVAFAIQGRLSIAIAAWMALWWLAETVPVAVTALIPIALFPLFGVDTLKAVCSAYAHPLIFLFFGGFLLSLAIEKWALHEWIAARVVALAAGRPKRLVAGFMAVAAFISMWLSNTATAIMLLPIAVSLITSFEQHANPGEGQNFAHCLLLGTAYGASIGGTMTLIGSPPNLFVASFINEQFGLQLGFRSWMVAAMPVCAVLLPLTWFVLTHWIAPLKRSLQLPRVNLQAATPWQQLSSGAKRVAFIFVLTALAWITRSHLTEWQVFDSHPLKHLSDTGIALLAGLSLFMVPGGHNGERLLAWQDVSKLPFGTLILFGGGLALAASLRATGADQFVGAQFAGMLGVPSWVIILSMVALIVVLTELTSNIATTTTLAPIVAGVALTLGLEPISLLVVTALAASCAFMMPVATPPNAIVFATDRISIAAMARAGLLINVLAVIVIATVAIHWIPWLVSRGALP